MISIGKSSFLIFVALAVEAAAQTFTGKATYHTDWSTNACDGKPKDGNQFIAALNPEQYGNGLGNNSPVCGQTITVTYEGKSAIVTIIDMGGVGMGGLDLSIAAFEHFQPLSVGFFNPTWSWNDCSPDSGTQNTARLGSVGSTGSTAVSTVATTASSIATPAVVPPAADSTSSASATSAAGSTAPANPPIATSAEPIASAPIASSSMISSATPIAPVASVSDPVAPVASVATSARVRPTGHRGGGRGGR